jgi:predicted ATP-dependent endonuclease of OLD family
MLKFTHTSKIFFVDTILLVEWETDEYFFNYFLNYLSTDPTWKERIKSYEIININWKWSHKMRRRFLEKFGLKAIYIWDWDNVIDEFPGVDFLEVRQQLKRHRHEHNEYRMRKTEKYKRLVEWIREYYPDLYNKIWVKIEQLQNNWIFILKQWDIESYLWLEEKWLTFMVDFCRHYFKSRLQNPKYISKRMEFIEMFDEIFPLSSQD